MIAALFGTFFLTYYLVPTRRHKQPVCGGGEPAGVVRLDRVQLDFRVRDAEDSAGERGLYRARIGRGDFALGAGLRVVDHPRRLLDRPLFATREMKTAAPSSCGFPVWQ